MIKKAVVLTVIGMVFTSAIHIGFISTAEAAFPGRNGKILLNTVRDGNNEVYSLDQNGDNLVNLTNNPAADYDGAWSPDGKKIAFRSLRDAGNQDIYVMRADGSQQTRITTHSANDVHPTWSPDGNKILFASDRDGDYEIFIVDADGSNPTQLTTNSTSDVFPYMSPDGNKITFRASRDGNVEVYIMNSDGSNQTNISNNSAQDSPGGWSPDGSKILFDSSRLSSINYEAFTMTPNGSSVTNLSNTVGNDAGADWSPDNLAVAFSRDVGSSNYEGFTMTNSGSSQNRITNVAGNDYLKGWQPVIGSIVNAGNNRTNTTVTSDENYPVLDYIVEGSQTVVLDGRLCDVTVQSGGILKGSGTACSITVQIDGLLNPGNSPGCMNSGNLAIHGTYESEIAGTTVCSQYDQIKVTGSVTLSGILNLKLLDGYSPTNNSAYVLIDNDGTDAVSGQFSNLPEGSTINVDNRAFKLSYTGGTGNDVVLTAVVLPGLPQSGNTPTTTLASYIFIAGLSGIVIGGSIRSVHRLRMR